MVKGTGFGNNKLKRKRYPKEEIGNEKDKSGQKTEVRNGKGR